MSEPPRPYPEPSRMCNCEACEFIRAGGVKKRRILEAERDVSLAAEKETDAEEQLWKAQNGSRISQFELEALSVARVNRRTAVRALREVRK